MVRALNNDNTAEHIEQPAPILKRIKVDVTSADFQNKTVADFVTPRSRYFFEACNLSTDFLSFDPNDWDNRADYKKSTEFVHKLNVVNDCAERGVALMQTYNNILTKNEDQKQYLLQVVEQHRRRVSNASKTKWQLQELQYFNIMRDNNEVFIWTFVHSLSCFWLVYPLWQRGSNWILAVPHLSLKIHNWLNISAKNIIRIS